jgi:hypothetical protein
MAQLAIRENWFEDLVELRRGFDQLFNRLLTGWPAVTKPERSPFALVPPAEVWVIRRRRSITCAWPFRAWIRARWR